MSADKKYFSASFLFLSIIRVSECLLTMLKEALLIACVTRCAGSQNMEPFVVGGKPAPIRYFGHSAFVTVEIFDSTFICGSSILNQNVILSAAHCFEGFSRYSKISVRAGDAHKLKGSLRYAARLAVHTGYNPATVENDIALAYLKKPLVFNDNIKRVIIMRRPPPSKVGYVAGWGLIDENRKTESNMLHQAKQRLWSREECKRVLKRIPAGILCGGIRHSNEYAAEGDSGSALIINGSIQIGLVSFKKPDISRSIVVYTDVTYFYNWIARTALKLHCSRERK